MVFTGAKDAVAGTNVIEGRPPSARSVDEILVSNSFLEQTGARLGDSFELSSLTQEQAARSLSTLLTQVGRRRRHGCRRIRRRCRTPGRLRHRVVLPVAARPRRHWFGGGIQCRHVGAGTTFDGLRAQLDTLPNGADLTISAIDWVPEPVRSAVRTQGQGLAVLALFAGVAAIAVIGQVLGRQHRLSDAERLALRTIGMTPRQLVADPLSRAAVPIVAGSIGSTVAALAFSARFPTGFVKQIESQPAYGSTHSSMSWVRSCWPCCYSAGCGTGLAPPIRASVSATTPIVDGIASRLQNVEFATGVRFAFSATRDRRWPAGSFFGLTIVLGVVVGALTLGANITRSSIDPRSGDQRRSASVPAATTSPTTSARARDGSRRGGGHVLRCRHGVHRHRQSLHVGMQPARGDLLPPVLSGRLPQSDDEIVLGAVAARTLDVGIGDEFDVSTEVGSTVSA